MEGTTINLRPHRHRHDDPPQPVFLYIKIGSGVNTVPTPTFGPTSTRIPTQAIKNVTRICLEELVFPFRASCTVFYCKFYICKQSSTLVCMEVSGEMRILIQNAFSYARACAWASLKSTSSMPFPPSGASYQHQKRH